MGVEFILMRHTNADRTEAAFIPKGEIADLLGSDPAYRPLTLDDVDSVAVRTTYGPALLDQLGYQDAAEPDPAAGQISVAYGQEFDGPLLDDLQARAQLGADLIADPGCDAHVDGRWAYGARPAGRVADHCRNLIALIQLARHAGGFVYLT